MLRQGLQRPLLMILFVLVLAGCGTLQEAAAPTTVAAPSPTSLQPTVAPQPTGTPGSPTPAATTPTSVLATPTAVPQPTAIPTPSTPTPTWIHKQFADAWSIEYPATWDVNEGGVHEGYVDMRGAYEGHRYEIYFFYPIFEQAVDSLEAWVMQELAKLPRDQRDMITVIDTTVGGAPAKKVLNVPETAPGKVSHQVYIWHSGDKNPRRIVIQPGDNQPPDAAQMEQLFERFLAGITAPVSN